MAAHVLTAMNEIVNMKTAKEFELAQHGIGYAAFGNQLELHDYSVLNALFTLAQLEDHLEIAKTAIRDYYYGDFKTSLYGRLNAEFEKYNHPDNYETWLERKFKKE